MQPDENVSFEDALKRLEAIVKTLESQEVTLEQSVALYKEGAACGNICRLKLETARHELEVWQGEQTQRNDQEISGEREYGPYGA